MTTDLDVYMERLKFRLRRLEIPASYFQLVGHPYINTPSGRILRPSLGKDRWNSGL